MKKYLICRTASLLLLITSLLASCGEDRSGEYYALIGPKMWMYETMQQYYLFHEDLPDVTDEKSFFKSPEDFLSQVISSKDQKNGTYFSHIDSVYSGTSRAVSSSYPNFGFEAALIRTESGDYAIHVLYTQANSPAEEAGLKRGDWIIAADGQKISSEGYSRYVSQPSQAYRFTLGALNGASFDTLTTVQMPSPSYVVQKSILTHKVLTVGNRKAGYVVYNEFAANDTEEWKTLLTDFANEGINDIILDLRYNPGGYVSTAVDLGSMLAPTTAIGQIFLKMTYNNVLNRTEELPIEDEGINLAYDNLYVISTGNTASASEIIINCLRPYMNGRMYQVGEATYGKNVAQTNFTNEQYPLLEFWLTTCYLSNAEDYYEYYDSGLTPDYNATESLSGTIVDFGEETDALLSPVLTHISTGSFPASDNDDTAEASIASRSTQKSTIVYNPIAHKPKLNIK